MALQDAVKSDQHVYVDWYLFHLLARCLVLQVLHVPCQLNQTVGWQTTSLFVDDVNQIAGMVMAALNMNMKMIRTMKAKKTAWPPKRTISDHSWFI